MRVMGWGLLLVLLVVTAACGPGALPPVRPSPEMTPTPIPSPTLIIILPTPTPLPPPPTPLPPVEEEAPMVLVPAGPFPMGSDEAEIEQALQLCRSGCQREWFQDEKPRHMVNLLTFYMDKYEVTNMEFARFVAGTGYVTEAERAGDSTTWRTYAEGKERHPVVEVSWADAQAYCRWAGKRLPTEAEWEKAARGSEGLTYPWGNDWEPGRANSREAGLRGTTVVGSFPEGVSPYGLFDMAGNVWEWTADWYQAYPGSDYQSEYFGQKFKVIRGGDWFSEKSRVRAARRSCTSVEATNDNLGFRCAKDGVPP